MQKKKSIIIDDRTYFETARTPLHIEYECYETYTDKEGHEHSYTLVEIRPRNFLGRSGRDQTLSSGRRTDRDPPADRLHQTADRSIP